eukprot:m.135324 g.135324  ORF g.135324 m.135324 type:complete len:1652 (+) comp14708_c0_seq14:81-5036(+)
MRFFKKKKDGKDGVVIASDDIQNVAQGGVQEDERRKEAASLLSAGLPPPHVRLFIESHIQNQHKGVRAGLIPDVLTWLIPALIHAHTEQKLKDTARALLAEKDFCDMLAIPQKTFQKIDIKSPTTETLNESKDTGNEKRQKGFTILHEAMRERLVVLGNELARIYAEMDIRSILTEKTLLDYISIHRDAANKDISQTLALPVLQDTELLNFESFVDFDERVALHIMMLVAVGINDTFQKRISKIAAKFTKTGYSEVPIYPYMYARNRMYACDGHRNLSKPRCAFNMDITRSVVSLQDPQSLLSFVKAINAEFKGIAKLENWFCLTKEEQRARFNLLPISLTVLFDSGWTFEQMCKNSEVQKKWKKYIAYPQDEPPERWERMVGKAMSILQTKKLGKEPVRLLTSVEVYLDQFSEIQNMMEEPKRVYQAGDWLQLQSDFARRTGKPAEISTPQSFLQACLCGDVNIVKKYIAEGVDTNKEDPEDGFPCVPLFAAAMQGHADVVHILLDAKANVDGLPDLSLREQSSFCQTTVPLMAAAENGFLDIVKMLVEAGADVTRVSEDQGTALALAAQNGFEDVVRFLLDKGSDPNIGGNFSPVYLAAREGHVEIVYLLAQADVKLTINEEQNGDYPLITALVHKHGLRMLEALVAAGADVQTIKSKGKTPLHWAFTHNSVKEVIDYLIAEGVDVNAPEKISDIQSDGPTPLHLAVTLTGNSELVKKLIESDANVNAVDERTQCDALYYAAQGGHLDCVDILIKGGASIDEPRSAGQHTALCIAAAQGHTEIVNRLLKAGANVNGLVQEPKEGIQGATPLYLATGSDNTDIVKILLDAGADFSLSCLLNEKATTPFTAAVSLNHADCVEMLLSAGQSSKEKLWGAVTPLYFAAQQGFAGVVESLVAHNANLEETEDGQTPLFVAAMEGHSNVITVLSKAGANLDASFKTQDLKEATLLFLATKNEDTPTVAALCEAGADTSIACPGKFDFTPLHQACVLGNLELVQTLCKYSVDVNQEAVNGTTATWCAAALGHAEIVAALGAAGADVSIAKLTTGKRVLAAPQLDPDGTSPLDVALRGGHIKVVQELINSGAFIEDGEQMMMVGCVSGQLDKVKKGIEGGASPRKGLGHEGGPLWVACHFGHVEVVEYLVEQGADVDQVTISSPLHGACETGHTDIVRYLLSKNANVTGVSKKSKKTTLGVATENGYSEITKLLLVASCDINNAEDASKAAPLIVSAVLGNYPEVVDILVNEGASIELKWSVPDVPCPTIPAIVDYKTEVSEQDYGDLQQSAAEYEQQQLEAMMGGLTLKMVESVQGRRAGQQRQPSVRQYYKNKDNGMLARLRDQQQKLFQAMLEQPEEHQQQQLQEHEEEVSRSRLSTVQASEFDRNGPPPLKTGFLTKQGGKIKTWKSREFMLTTKALRYFTPKGTGAKDKDNEKGHILLKDIVDVDKARHAKRNHILAIKTESREYLCQAATEEDRDDWVQVIKAAMKGKARIDKKKSGDKAGQSDLANVPEEEETLDIDLLQPMTILGLAATHGFTETIAVLLKNGADVAAVTTADKGTAIHIAASLGDAESLKVLCDGAGDKLENILSQQLDTGGAPLYLAAVGGHVEAVKVLVGAGADLYQKNESTGHDAVSIAAMRRHTDVINAIFLQE